MKLTAVPASAKDWSTAGPPDRTAVQIRPVRRITAGGDETNGAFTFLEWAAPRGSDRRRTGTTAADAAIALLDRTRPRASPPTRPRSPPTAGALSPGPTWCARRASHVPPPGT
ncbi:MAG TPA: hypothetical protein VNO54_17115 [Streptosporangiaceae bacterium]|nr:hypothetical protein [Streptosporangiaceae bacterium]